MLNFAEEEEGICWASHAHSGALSIGQKVGMEEENSGFIRGLEAAGRELRI